MIYRILFQLLLRRVPAEAAHFLASQALRAVGAIPGARIALRRLTLPRDGSLQVRALGQTFPSPLGVGAGLDKQAQLFGTLGAIGFGFVEVGTVTAAPQPGQSRPRVWRLTPERALLNRLGFPNPGASTFAQRLRARRGPTIVGVNIGKSKVAPLESAGADYRLSTRAVAPFADYLVVNVSSPNTPGLREMQAVERLRPLLREIKAELKLIGARVPLLVKVGPDLGDEELDRVADLAVELGLDGIVAVNTTVSRAGLSASARWAESIQGGGISGSPLKTRAVEVLARLYARVGHDLVLISVGGIETPADAWERILAGATLVQAYTGFVYGGPGWPRSMNRALRRRVRQAGVGSIEAMIGAGAPLRPRAPTSARVDGTSLAESS